MKGVNTGVSLNPSAAPRAELEVGSSVSIEAALRDHITDQLIPLEISVQLVEVNAITVPSRVVATEAIMKIYFIWAASILAVTTLP
jgi:hypothetical protein